MICRCCQTPLEDVFLDLGTAPASNSYLAQSELDSPEAWHPLRLYTCKSCLLVQAPEWKSHREIFSTDYAYFSSMSSTWLEHARVYAESMIPRLGLDASSRVLEIASNDGYLLRNFVQRGIPCLGIEPCQSVAEAAMAIGVPTRMEFFGEQFARSLANSWGRADLVAANNVLAHVPDILDFCRGVAAILSPQGLATFEFPHLAKLMEHNQFDTVYHEHYSYLSLWSVRQVMARTGLVVAEVEELPTHGGSLRVHVRRADSEATEGPSVGRILDAEFRQGLHSTDGYKDFQIRASTAKNDFLSFLLQARTKGWKVGAYGAAAKGNTLLNYAGIRSDLLAMVADLSPSKQGRFLPGSRIPVVSPQQLLSWKPDCVVILPWNIRHEICDQLREISAWGASFAVAIPHLRVWKAGDAP
ncbi:MAG: class I SAM-dependent methyltransferase [Fibrobacterota bacterium]|nr:class I SAM-dependent methyltransferase [Fibrobacterota bacterium]QQS07073.1 MAG: class I SAM-dependent methyltransferase [Fibrobacterota bacterium]